MLINFELFLSFLMLCEQEELVKLFEEMNFEDILNKNNMKCK